MCICSCLTLAPKVWFCSINVFDVNKTVVMYFYRSLTLYSLWFIKQGLFGHTKKNWLIVLTYKVFIHKIM